MEIGAIVSFLFAAVALLGSPGPAIAALLVVGRVCTRTEAVRYFLALQAGLALAAGFSALGLVALLKAFPALHGIMLVISIAYLIALAWTIATAPPSGGPGGDTAAGRSTAWRPWGAFILGITNPKAYLAFASLFGTFVLLPPDQGLADSALKWLLVVAVIFVVDVAWLLAGRALGRIEMAPRTERAFNITMGAAILAACVASVA